jgi:hypothetical protein
MYNWLKLVQSSFHSGPGNHDAFYEAILKELGEANQK